MKTIWQLMLSGIFSVISLHLSAQISINGYNVYYGHLHNHCAYSDGKGTPASAYIYARDYGKLDFFSLSDHEYSLTPEEYTQIKKTADSINSPGSFTAFYGFEWSHSTYGHVTVTGSTDYCTSGASPTNTFSGLVNWLSTRECVAFFNHPGRQNSTGTEFNQFTTAPSDKFVVMELWNKTDRFEDYYYNDGYFSGDGTLGFYDEALTRGWKTGAAGSEDNHTGTWGTMTPSKLAVLAKANTRTDIMEALKARRFYSTYDKTMALSFTIGGNEMGSTIPGGEYQLKILAHDDALDPFSRIELLMNGAVINSWTPGSNEVNITQTITCFDGNYFYLRIKQADADEAITSPIWIEGGTANNPPSIYIISPEDYMVEESHKPVHMEAIATDLDGSISKVTFYLGNTILGEVTSSPYTYTWPGGVSGVYKVTAIATDNQGSTKISDPVTLVIVDPNTVNSRISAIQNGSDDAEESESGTLYITSTDLELVYDSYNQAGNQTVGLRFRDLFLPQGITVTRAYIQFTCDESGTSAVNLEIRGEAADHSLEILSSPNNLSGRTKTESVVYWMPPAWTSPGESGENQRTPDISPLVQEIVNRTGFSPASAIMILITGTGSRIAEAYEGSPASAPKLIIEFMAAQLVTPVFDPIGPLMQGSEPPVLPSTSLNGITGTWDPPVISTGTPGTFTFLFTPGPGQKATSTTMDINILPAAMTTTAFIVSGNDDVEEYNSGTMLLNSPVINLVYDSKSTGNQKIGLRFSQVGIPAGSVVSKAWLQFTAMGKTTTATNLTIAGQAADNALPFTSTKKNVSGRAKTASTVKWIPSGWTSDGAAGEDQKSPDLTTVIQEIVNRTGWKSGNSMVFIITGTGTRSAVAYETSPQKAARLTIEYTTPVLKSAQIHQDMPDMPGTPANTDKLFCYPVPFTEKLTILFTPEENEVLYNTTIYNISGQLVTRSNSSTDRTEINLAGYPSGVYIVKALTNLGSYEKLVTKN